MRSCKDIAKLLTPNKNLSFFQKVEVKMHLMICTLCRKYEKQLKLLSFAQKKNIAQKEHDSKEQVCELEKQVIDEITKSDLK